MSNARHGRLAGKVAIVTGGAQGIGRGTAQRFVEEGARVLVSDIQVEKGEATVAAINAIAPEGAGATFMKADILEPAEIEAMVAHAVELYGRLDILVNNAYWNAGGTAVTIGLDDWNKAQAAMVTAPMLGAKYAVPHMVAGGGGSVITISSVHGLLAAANGVAYETAKGALILLTKAMAVDFGPDNVRVNAICPGYISHDAQNRTWQQDPYPAGLQKMNYPLRRWGSPLDIANGALYLASDEAQFVTGHALVIDGGMTVQLQDSHSQRVAHFVEEFRKTHG
ncbi:MAG: SDR family oxidoreductase [Chloroflexi bacterium]|jgi:NAD(P)-dependent dehydrogenase (short-subunit alcohol dehydrogenase family)|nr:SDR family oxidoreductase [Chloroflexota bacterium]